MSRRAFHKGASDSPVSTSTATSASSDRLVVSLDSLSQVECPESARSLELSSRSAMSISSFGTDGCPAVVPSSKVAEPGLASPQRSRLLARRHLAKALHVEPLEPGTPPRASPKSSAVLSKLFEVQEMLGQGTVASVYRAWRRRDALEVALKVVRSEDEAVLAATDREFEYLQKLAHPNIVRALDLLTLADRRVLVLEYFPGQELAAAVPGAAGGRLGEAVARRLFSQILAAVAYLHDQSLAHRDVKPQNVLVSRDLRTAKLVDFNTACCPQDDGSLTMTGTTLYMAPEVLQGDSPSAESDVWASGLCLYFMLSGELPQGRQSFAKATIAELRSASERPLSFGRGCWSDVSAACQALLERALALEPGRRPTAAQLAEDIWFSEHDA